MARYFHIEIRDNVVHYSTTSLVAALECAYPGLDFYIEEYPAIAGGASYFVPSAKRSDGTFLKLLKPDERVQLSFGSTMPLEVCLALIAASVAAAEAALLPSGTPRPVKRSR
jgi:hypothetical protein